jgi:hypothetical protein
VLVQFRAVQNEGDGVAFSDLDWLAMRRIESCPMNQFLAEGRVGFKSKKFQALETDYSGAVAGCTNLRVFFE